MKLPDDVCRCCDESCELKRTCLRYLQKETGSVHATSLKNEIDWPNSVYTCNTRLVIRFSLLVIHSPESMDENIHGLYSV